MWDYRDEIQRLDGIAGMVGPTALAAAAAAATIIVTADLKTTVDWILGIGAIGFAVLALVAFASLAWTPFQGGVASPSSLDQSWRRKRRRTRLALWGLVFSVELVFGLALAFSVA